MDILWVSQVSCSVLTSVFCFAFACYCTSTVQHIRETCPVFLAPAVEQELRSARTIMCVGILFSLLCFLNVWTLVLYIKYIHVVIFLSFASVLCAAFRMTRITLCIFKCAVVCMRALFGGLGGLNPSD